MKSTLLALSLVSIFSFGYAVEKVKIQNAQTLNGSLLEIGLAHFNQETNFVKQIAEKELADKDIQKIVEDSFDNYYQKLFNNADIPDQVMQEVINVTANKKISLYQLLMPNSSITKNYDQFFVR